MPTTTTTIRAITTTARTTVAPTTSLAVTSTSALATTSRTSSAVTSRTSSGVTSLVTSTTSSGTVSVTSSAITTTTTVATTITTSSTTTTSTSTTSFPPISQVVPNVSSNSSNSSSSSSSSTIPLFAIIILGVVGGLIALFLGYRVWSGSWRLFPRRNKDDILPPPRVGLLEPINEKDFKSSPYTPGSDWRRSSYGFPNREGSNSVLLKDDGSFAYNEKRASGNGGFFDAEKYSNGSDLMLPPKIAAYYAAGDSGSESGRSSISSSPVVGEFGLPDSPMVNQAHSTLASDATRVESLSDGKGYTSRPSSSSGSSSPLPPPIPRPPKGTNPNRNSLNSLPSATYPQRRSVYAMSLYSTPHHDPQLLPISNSYNRPSSGYFAANPNNRVSGAPHSRNSRIELSIPQPLGPPPGAVTATDKATLGFTNLSGIKVDKNGVAQQSENNWLKEVIDDSKNRVDREVEEVLNERERKKSGMSWGSGSFFSNDSRAGREGRSESESRERSTSRPNNSTFHERTASSASFASTNANTPVNAHGGSRSAQLSSIGEPFGSSSNPQSSGDSAANSGRNSPLIDLSVETSDFERSPLDNLKREMRDRSTSGSGSEVKTVYGGPILKLDGRSETRQGISPEPKEPSVESPTLEISTMIIPTPISIEQAADQNNSAIKTNASLSNAEEVQDFSNMTVQPKHNIPSTTDEAVVQNS